MDGCNKKHASKGFCATHYQRFKKYGDLLYTKYQMHGKRYSPEYSTWDGIKARCHNKNNKRYKDWGGRGITVCNRWLYSFDNFLEDMREKPTPEHQIDRIDNNKGYYKENCRWVTQAENNRNRRSTILNIKIVREIRFLFATGSYTRRALSKKYNLSYSTIKSIINNSKWKEI